MCLDCHVFPKKIYVFVNPFLNHHFISYIPNHYIIFYIKILKKLAIQTGLVNILYSNKELQITFHTEQKPGENKLPSLHGTYDS